MLISIDCAVGVEAVGRHTGEKSFLSSLKYTVVYLVFLVDVVVFGRKEGTLFRSGQMCLSPVVVSLLAG